MTQLNNVAESPGKRSFRYGRHSRYGRYLVLVLGLVFIYLVLAHDGGQPFSNFGFPLIVGLVLLDIVGGEVLRVRSPRAFHLHGDQLTIEWARDVLSVSANEANKRAFLSLLLNSGYVFCASGRTFAVFKDLEEFEEFVGSIR